VFDLIVVPNLSKLFHPLLILEEKGIFQKDCLFYSPVTYLYCRWEREFPTPSFVIPLNVRISITRE
jgi:hypothetical protein